MQKQAERRITVQEFIEEYRNKEFAPYILNGMKYIDNPVRYELIDGLVYMAPSPSRKHQTISGFLTEVLRRCLKGHKCQLFTAPFDVFPEETLKIKKKKKDDDTEYEENYGSIVQPDLFVVCDKSKLKENGCHGAPDFIIEISSPSSMDLDYNIKLNLYAKNRVKEYWVINPASEKILVYKIADSGKVEDVKDYSFTDIVSISCLNNIEIDFSEFEYD